MVISNIKIDNEQHWQMGILQITGIIFLTSLLGIGTVRRCNVYWFGLNLLLIKIKSCYDLKYKIKIK